MASQFGGILFALEQAVARDNANRAAIVNSRPPEGCAEDHQSNSSDEDWEERFAGDHFDQMANFEVEDGTLEDSARCRDINGQGPPNRKEERSSSLCSTACEFVPAPKIYSCGEDENGSNHSIPIPDTDPTRVGGYQNEAGPRKAANSRRRKNPRRRHVERASEKRGGWDADKPKRAGFDRDAIIQPCDDLPKEEDGGASSQKLHDCLSAGGDETSGEGKLKDPAPWKNYIPEGTVDPISLELLAENDYPPFALVVDKPYTPIFPGMWPPVDTNEDGREKAILKQQWGDGIDITPAKEAVGACSLLLGRNLNLFDGHILANYLVSTQQYIDPYNRRDLTRGELEALDVYLEQNNLPYAGVCLSYDNRSTITMAGSRAQSAAGRAVAHAEILRRNADSILSEMFTMRKSNVGSSTKMKKGKFRDRTFGADKIKMIDRETMNSLQQTKVVLEDNNCAFRDSEALEANLHLQTHDETGVYEGGGGGLLLIDDDINPGLRGKVEVADEAAKHFPSLPTTKGDSVNSASHRWGSQNSLSRVCKPAKMANPKLAEKQRKEAVREQRQTEEFQLPNNNSVESHSSSEFSKTSWSRPVSDTANINPVKYEATLIARATIHLSELIKLENKLIKFLANEKKPSLSLKPMVSESLRKLAEDYCKCWRLQTIGFLEAARNPDKDIFIDCNKRDDTCAPYPLLSHTANHPVLGITNGFKKKKNGKKKAFNLAFAD